MMNSNLHEMTDGEHVELLDGLNDLEGSVMVSGYPSPLYEAYIGHWRRIERRALADGALERTEVLWMNYKAERDLFTEAYQ